MCLFTRLLIYWHRNWFPSAPYTRNFTIDISRTQTKLQRNLLSLEVGKEQSKKVETIFETVYTKSLKNPKKGYKRVKKTQNLKNTNLHTMLVLCSLFCTCSDFIRVNFRLGADHKIQRCGFWP